MPARIWPVAATPCRARWAVEVGGHGGAGLVVRLRADGQFPYGNGQLDMCGFERAVRVAASTMAGARSWAATATMTGGVPQLAALPTGTRTGMRTGAVNSPAPVRCSASRSRP
ncbi:hypothetical protein JHN63_04190 [Streptomyces sp. MBT65]|uniref:hypothetical protein n=1 Tax=Streptomyces sp. MBT65 TaxID=1488395 RepID=UPI00190D240F|nr:hypothetical protein [Streptomyces sp. MBT65]MBK3573036.1 hypothetical protein [Streptomyces sp. MBT65]